MNLTILQTASKRVVLVSLRYPYGKNQVYMNGSVVSLAAKLMAAGHEVDIVDLNLETLDDERVIRLLSKAHVIGTSVSGSPYIPPAIEFCQYATRHFRQAKLAVGGKAVHELDPTEFRRIFGKLTVQDGDEVGCAALFGKLESAFDCPFSPVWERMGNERLKKYLSTEFALVVSQGCLFDCDFCGADKGQPEQHRGLRLFENDIRFLMKKAQEFGLSKLECYASSLDLFQNPNTVQQYLRSLADVFQDSGITLRMRALTCTNTFLKASRVLNNFPELLKSAGLWCVGFGVDGPNEEVWKLQHKLQNHQSDVLDCLDLCLQLQIRAEVLMVMGYPDNSIKQLWTTVRSSLHYARHWNNVMLRPYLAKEIIPGNVGWKIYPAVIEQLIARPGNFYNLDFCSLGSAITHPRMLQRWLANLSFLAVILALTPFGRCCTSPLLPQGGRGVYGRFAKLINRHMPFDR